MEPLSQTQLLYAGEFRPFIDHKNRITIPARWRRDESGEFLILPEAIHQFLLVMSPEQFARMSSAAASNANVSARYRRFFLRQLPSSAQHGASDRQGRLVLPEERCKKIGLKGE